jgi:hypothetical protein
MMGDDPFAPKCGICATPMPEDDPTAERHRCDTGSVLDAALRYADAGVYVFPVLVEIVDGSKKVMPIGAWRETSTAALDTIRGWWSRGSRWECASLAIDCGKSKLVAIDPDGPAGIAAWDALVDEHGIVSTHVAATPGGGQHWYYREHPRRVVGIDASGKVAPSVDVRGLGGFVIAPPSVDARGGYRWLNDEPGWPDLPIVPDIVIERMNVKPAAGEPPSDGEPFTTPGRRFTRQQAQDFVTPHIDALTNARTGDKTGAGINDRLNAAARVFSHFVPAFWTAGQVHTILNAALTHTAYDGKTWQAGKTIDSGLTRKAGDWVAELVDETTPGPEPAGGLDDDFWGARAYLKHIRDAAHSRQRSAPAVLGVVLARTAALISHRIRIPAIVGSAAGLSLITIAVAPSGIGKSTANEIGSALLPAPVGLDVADQLPIGSGEGIAESFIGIMEEQDGGGKPQKVRRQVRHNAYFFVDEGQVLAEIGGRRGATLLPTIRSAFSGTTLGQANAQEQTRRIIPAGNYTLGIVVAMQTTLAGDLLDDTAGGTPQRLIWLPATDPTIPDQPPGWPGRLPWSPPSSFDLARLEAEDLYAANRGVYLPVADPVKTEIRTVDLARVRGQTVADPLDAHAQLIQLKLAALLAILDGRLDLTAEDWALAAVLRQVSDRTRSQVIEEVKADATMREAQQSSRMARRAAHADAVVAQRRLVDCSRKIAERVWAEPERWTRKTLRNSSGYRDVFDEALERAVLEGWVVEVTEPGQGGEKRVLRPGEVKPR